MNMQVFMLAKHLGVDPATEFELMSLVRQVRANDHPRMACSAPACCDGLLRWPLISGWWSQAVSTKLPGTIQERNDPETGEKVFYDTLTKTSSQNHPFEDSARQVSGPLALPFVMQVQLPIGMADGSEQLE